MTTRFRGVAKCARAVEARAQMDPSTLRGIERTAAASWHLTQSAADNPNVEAGPAGFGEQS